jgi:hypothetical protein
MNKATFTKVRTEVSVFEKAFLPAKKKKEKA